MEVKRYRSIEKEATGEFKDRGSKFLGYAFPINSVEGFELRLEALKEEHGNGKNYCYAYRLGIEGEEYRVNDDNEPSGSAGMPIYNQLRSNELTNIGVIVVRYYGGTKLGIPGLIHAFKMATDEALQSAEVVEREEQVCLSIAFTYGQMNDVMVLVKRNDLDVVMQDFDLDCKLEVNVPVSKLEEVEGILQNMKDVNVKRKNV